MKTFALFIFSILAETIHCSAQYTPMLGDSNKWYVYYNFRKLEGPFYPYCGYNTLYYTKSDSTFNGKPYKKVYIRDNKTCGDNYHIGAHSGFVGLIREDTLEQRLYFINKGFSNELVIYDFNLSTGDSIDLWFEKGPNHCAGYSELRPPETGRYAVKASVSGGKKIIKIEKDGVYPTSPLDWVEGIGSLKSPLYFLNPISAFGCENSLVEPTTMKIVAELKCAYRNTVQTYSVGKCQEDSAPSGIPFFSQELEPHIYRSGGSLYIETKFKLDNPVLSLFNMRGQKIVLSINSESAYRFTAPTENLHGLYVVLLASEEKYYSQKIFIP